MEQGLGQEVLAGEVFARLAGGLGVGVWRGVSQGREGGYRLESLAASPGIASGGPSTMREKDRFRESISLPMPRSG